MDEKLKRMKIRPFCKTLISEKIRKFKKTAIWIIFWALSNLRRYLVFSVVFRLKFPNLHKHWGKVRGQLWKSKIESILWKWHRGWLPVYHVKLNNQLDVYTFLITISNLLQDVNKLFQFVLSWQGWTSWEGWRKISGLCCPNWELF